MVLHSYSINFNYSLFLSRLNPQPLKWFLLELYKLNAYIRFATGPAGQFRINFLDLYFYLDFVSLLITYYEWYFFTFAHIAFFYNLTKPFYLLALILYSFQYGVHSRCPYSLTYTLFLWDVLFCNVFSYVLSWLHPIRTDGLSSFPYMVRHIQFTDFP